MAPFSVSSLKEKASQVKNASVKSYGSTRDRLSTNNSSKPPPLAPPRRASSNQSSDFVAHPPGVPRGTTNIDWANLSDEDKQVFFTWLDEFFARYLDLPASATRPTAPISAERPSNMSTPSPQSSPSLPPRRASTTRSSQITRPTPPDVLAPAQTPSISGRRNLPPAFSQQGPPRINYSTKPSASTEVLPPSLPDTSTRVSHVADPVASTDLQMSFPPPTANGSAAADLAVFMHPSTPWDTEWYASNSPIPPYLNGSPEIRFAGSFGSSGPSTKIARGVVLFSDLSICWYSVTYGRGTPATRWARFRPCPSPISSAAALRHAAETHGAAVAAFAEQAAASGRPVARGECWDIAHEALLHASSLFGPRDAPVLSTSRAHGHLLFCGKPGGVGRWRGADDRFRAGDVVEWRSVRIGGAQPGSFSILGDPDHTAVLVADTVPRCAVADGMSVRPADVGVLTVVEQTAGRAPKRESYDLAKLLQGEVWVYRPIGMVEYLGSTLNVDIPPGLETFAV